MVGRIAASAKIIFTPLWHVLKEAAGNWATDRASSMGAALAYYSVFSLGPLLMIATAVVGLIFGHEAAQGEIAGNLQSFMGPDAARTVQGLIAGAQKHSTGILATVLSVVTLLVAALGVVVQLKDSLNSIWGVKTKPGRSMHVLVREYIISLAAILGFSFILLTSLIITTVLAVMGKYMSSLLPLPEVLLQFLDSCTSFLILTFFFAAMFKLLPDVKIRWRDVAFGALGTAFFFMLGKTLIGLYLGKQSFDSTYGAAASVVAVLVWVYYLAQVFFFGAECTKAYVHYLGHGVEPTADAFITAPLT